MFLYSLARLGYVSVHTGNNGDEGPAQLDNYRFIVDDPIFRDAVKHNLLLLLSVPVVLVLALAIAFVLHEGVRGWRVYRTIIFLPYMLAIPVLGTTFVYLLSLNGVINTVFGAAGLGFLEQDWLGDPSWVLSSIATIIVYHELGFGVVLFLARLLSLPEEVDQAAPHRRLHLVAAQAPHHAAADALGDHRVRDARADHDAVVGLRVRVLDHARRSQLRQLRARVLRLRQRLHVPVAELRRGLRHPPAARDDRADHRPGAPHVGGDEP